VYLALVGKRNVIAHINGIFFTVIFYQVFLYHFSAFFSLQRVDNYAVLDIGIIANPYGLPLITP